MRIAILDDYQNVVKDLECFSLLEGFEVEVYTSGAHSADELISRLKDVDGVVLIRARTSLPREVLSDLPRLKIISQTGKIGQHVDRQACADYGIATAEGVGSPIATAELCWTLIMAASRFIVPYAGNLKAGQWQDSNGLGLGRCLHGKTLGIWGYGRIGKIIAGYGAAFGMNVLAWGSEVSRKNAVTDGYSAAWSKKQLFSESDVLSLHLKLVEETAGCVTFQDLLAMGKDALFVNTSRASLIETGALCRALTQGCPGFAAVDVFENEPASKEEEPLLHLPNVLCTPHIGYVEQGSYELYFSSAFQNIVKFFSKKPVC